MKQIYLLVAALLFSISSFAVVDPIVGPTTMCAGSTITLTDATPGGTWSSSSTALATITSTGAVTGISSGIVNITYAVGIDYVVHTVTLNALPSPYVVTGGGSYCAGGTGITIGQTGSTAGADYQLYRGVTPIGTPIAGTGSAISFGSFTTAGNYTVVATNATSGCARQMVGSPSISINPLPTAYTLSAGSGCAGNNLILSGSNFGTNYQLYLGAAAVGVLAGTGASLNFGPQTVPGVYSAVAINAVTGCTNTMGSATLNPTPVITGGSAVCAGATIALSGTGTWSSSNSSIATVTAGGVVTGVALGVANITLTSGTGCHAVKPVTVSPIPTAIAGPSSVCTGSSITLTNSVPGGVWTSSSAVIVTVGALTGVVTSVSAGTATITYSLGTGCVVTKVITANPLPAAPTSSIGTFSFCTGASITAMCATSGGIWSSSSTAILVGSSSGTVTGLAAGHATITYTTGTGCYRTAPVTVNPTPVITGPTSVCVGGTATLTSIAGVTWSCSNPTVATISSTGIVAGLSIGLFNIICTHPSGCSMMQTFTVTPATCTGTPTGGTTNASSSTACYGNPISLSLTGTTVGCAIAYQWQRSADGTTFTDIAGATSTIASVNAAATEYYRCKVTCPTTGLFDHSTPAHVTVNTTIASHTIASSPDTVCNNLDFYISACGLSTSFNVTTWFGDGTSANTPLTLSGVYGAHIYHSYNAPGTYNIKQVLYIGTVAQDTATFSYEYKYCRTLPIKFYFDANSNCVYDAGDKNILLTTKTRVDSNGTPVDTISATSGFYYKATGPAGTIYTFNVISLPSGAVLTCPAGGVIRDTITSTVNNYQTKYFGLNCGGGSAYDLAQFVSTQTGRHMQIGTITVNNTSCPSTNVVVTLHFSPKYNFKSSSPAPTSTTARTATWHLTAVSSTTKFPVINYDLRVPNEWVGAWGSTWLLPGDTAHSSYITLAPGTGGETDTTNNFCQKIDTVRSSFDPNDIAVSPSGYILPCTKLQYTIRFENDGNDTAHNIHVMDTLSNNLDVNSLEIETATAAMNIAIIKDGPYQIVKFDFPNIMLPDSSHHNECQGMVIYNIRTKPGIADGTIIPNQAGIYFDDNPPVMTNTIQNVVGIAPIAGPNELCHGTTIGLDNGTTGGTWSSSNTAVATIGSATGIVAGSTSGTTTISYTASNICGSRSATKVITVNTTPSAITGTTGICLGSTSTLGNSSPGGQWSSSNPAVAIIGSSSGSISGITTDTATITYELNAGCRTSTLVTVHPAPAAISGTGTLCIGGGTTITNVTPGGIWTSGSTSIASIGSLSGVVSASAAGIASFSYTLNTGCSATKTITVHANPAAISGTGTLCSGTTTTLTNATASGTWSSGNTAIATIDVSGIVTGGTTGTANITYTTTGGCTATTMVTVHPNPAPISGTANLCSGTTTTLTNPTTGGLWSASGAAVGSVSGVVSGTTAGTANITYTLASGCSATKTVTIHANPAAISGTGTLCIGTTTTLTNTTPSGTWSSGNTAIATVDVSGIVTGGSTGAANITYTTTGGCTATTMVSVYPNPLPISGASTICSGTTTTLTNLMPGGIWSASGAAVGPASGIVSATTAGTAIITYTLASGCSATKNITVHATPAAISGITSLCSGYATALTDATPSGTWSSSNPAVASIVSSGTVTGGTAGYANITYTTGNGCFATTMVTVYPVPAPISGTTALCSGASATYSNAMPTGTWHSGASSVASVGSGTGMVTGISAGTAEITYLLSTGCYATKTITIQPVPAPISGAGYVCVGATTSLTDATASGTWSGNPATVATIDAAGMVTGVSAGIADITYALGTGCRTTRAITIHPLPAPITGTGILCNGATATLTTATPSGVWSSSGTSVATIGVASGIVSGISAGITIITYSLSTGCMTTAALTVNPLPAIYSLTGGGSYCSGTGGVHVGLSGSSAGINYFLHRGATATGPFPGSGSTLDLGLQTLAGTYTVSATDPATTCHTDMPGSVPVTIVPSVTPAISMTASPGTTICAGTPVVFMPTAINGGATPIYHWTVNGVSVSTGTSYSFLPANGDVVRVRLTSTATCASPDTVNTSMPMHVINSGTLAVTITASPGVNITAGETVIFTASATGGSTSLSYQWSINGMAVPGATSSVIVSNLLFDGDVVKCEVTDNGPCITGSDKSVTITLNTTGLNTITTKNRITVFPNPNKGLFNIKGSLGSTINGLVPVSVTDMLGRRQYDGVVSAVNGNIDTYIQADHLAAGVYLLTIHSGEGDVVAHFVVAK